MRPAILCRERLERIQRVLKRLGGVASVRDLARSHSIYGWEIEQAAQLGWLTFSIRRPRVGRPARMVEFRGLTNADFPPPRWSIEKAIRPRHCLFALHSVAKSVRRGRRSLGMPGRVSAYVSIYRPRSRRGARTSTSRLLKRRDVRAAQQWFYAQSGRELPLDERMPDTASGIRRRLRELGNRRADYF